MPAIRSFLKRHRTSECLQKIKMRTNLNADAMFATIRHDLEMVPDHRAVNNKIPLADSLMSAFAMFSLKDPSLLAFDQRRQRNPHSLHYVYCVGIIPCDSQMRTINDEVDPEHLRRPFRSLFHQAQRGKALSRMTWLDGHYLLALDGTGFFSSEKIDADFCLQRKKRNGEIEYHLQILAGVFIHPDLREVIPICPEMIQRRDGDTKDDCERNAAKRILADFRREHPHLKVIVTQDGIASNAPHIRELQRHDLRFILGAKPDDHKFLFDYIDRASEAKETTEFCLPDPDSDKIFHCFRFLNDVPLNKANQDLMVNFLEYWQTDAHGKVTRRFAWVTDLELTGENVYDIMRGGRARWRIENETFNTLKNQGYNLGHNYGLGKKHLSEIFVRLMMLAFMVDQLQQLCCPLFQAARKSCSSRRELWEEMRTFFRAFVAESMEAILRSIVDQGEITVLTVARE
jgi:hypothetical protein